MRWQCGRGASSTITLSEIPMPTDTIVWEEVRPVYDDHSIPIAKICDQFGITRPELTKARNELGWTPRFGATDPRRQLDQLVPDDALEYADANDADGPAPSRSRAKRSRSKRPAPIAKRRELVARITDVIQTKIAILEKRFQRELENTKRKRKPKKTNERAGAGGATPATNTEKDTEMDEPKFVSSADAERDQRAISLIIKNLELVREYGHAPQPGPHLRGAAAKSASLAATQLADEADRIRRELGERLSRLVEAPEAPAPGNPAGA